MRESLTARAKEFNILVDDIAITHLSFGTEARRPARSRRLPQCRAKSVEMRLVSAWCACWCLCGHVCAHRPWEPEASSASCHVQSCVSAVSSLVQEDWRVRLKHAGMRPAQAVLPPGPCAAESCSSAMPCQSAACVQAGPSPSRRRGPAEPQGPLTRACARRAVHQGGGGEAGGAAGCGARALRGAQGRPGARAVD